MVAKKAADAAPPGHMARFYDVLSKERIAHEVDSAMENAKKSGNVRFFLPLFLAVCHVHNFDTSLLSCSFGIFSPIFTGVESNLG